MAQPLRIVIDRRTFLRALALVPFLRFEFVVPLPAAATTGLAFDGVSGWMGATPVTGAWAFTASTESKMRQTPTRVSVRKFRALRFFERIFGGTQ